MEYPFFTSLVVIFGVSAIVVFLLHKLRIPSVVGFLIAGVLIGPYGVGLVKDTNAVEMMAEIGVILLLFTVGIEFSISSLLRMKKEVLVGGGVQIGLTIAVSAVVMYFATGDINRSVFFGFLVALSSTAIVLKILSERGEVDSPHGRVMVGILIAQDLCVVLLMLVTPALSGAGLQTRDLALTIGKAILIIAGVLLSARWIIPNLLHQVVGTKSRELFVITIILLCLGIALLTSRFGLSLALGAFLAGLVISESEYAHQASSDILPFKDSFIGLFFVSVGMLMNLGFMTAHCLRIAVAVALIFVIKVVTGTVSALAAGANLRTSFHSGMGLAQIGEFSFVLAVTGRGAGLMTEDFYQIFLSSSVVTMIMTPFVLSFSPLLSARITSGRAFRALGAFKELQDKEEQERWDGHVVIIGFGLNGRNIAMALKEAGIPYAVLEMNSATVREMKQQGEPIFYGDGTSVEILRKIGIERARLLIVAISDPAATRRIVSIARHENPGLYVIVRTRYLAEVEDLKKLGANEVIPEEFETSIEIFSRALHRYNFPNHLILEMVDRIRSDNYTALRSVDLPRRHLFEQVEWLPEIEIDGFRVAEGSFLAGKSIAELHIRERTGSTVVAVRRGSEVFTNPDPSFSFEAGDVVLFTGNRKSMNAAINYFKGLL